MSAAAERHRDQIAYWNGAAGERWVAAQEHTDKMLVPVSQALLNCARPEPGMAVLDIGCGCGAATLDLAMAVGTAGHVTGIDVSHPMLERARSRLSAYPQVELLEADAAAHPFTPFADLAISRFGVMFFGDPAAAFANIRKALKPGGRLVFACWRKLEENPWMQLPLEAAFHAGVPRLPQPGPEDPGPFSFCNPERVTGILTGAGFIAPSVSPVSLSLDISAGGGLTAAVQQSMRTGAASAALRDQPDSVRAAAASAIEKALEPYASGNTVKLPAGIWLVESRPA
ncbi:MAG: class I SAM-dependent methyltransferase [Rhodomicrobium sp.]|nr:class I SAM-dependent methyltransferase [Rhodomicrobium sp.]